MLEHYLNLLRLISAAWAVSLDACVRGSAIPLGCALAALWAAPAQRRSDLKLFTPDTFELSGDVRLVAVDGEKSWVDGGFGKLRSGSDGDLRVQPQLGNVSLVWKPQFTWSLGAIVVGSVQGGERTEAGLSQAYLTFRPMRSSKVAFSARAGLMWPPVSLEHEGADWHVKDSITPSAINSWIGEEVRPVAAEGTIAASLGEHKLRATAALMAANDTAGTLLTFRGWALHDRTTLAFSRQPLPPLGRARPAIQAPFTHPLIDLAPRLRAPAGLLCEARLAAAGAGPRRAVPLRQSRQSRGRERRPRMGLAHAASTMSALVADLGSGAELKAQALQGRTRMGYPDDRPALGRRPLPLGLRDADAAVRTASDLPARADAFDTRNRGSVVGRRI